MSADIDELHFEFADLNEIKEIMRFISTHWNDKHIYSISRELLCREFSWLDNPDKLTIGLAKDMSGEILGVFCFKFYNYSDEPDLAGSLWKVTEEAEKKYQMIGFRLRQFVIRNIKHRFFSAPGPGVQTRVIYQMLRLQWQQMKQYYAINPLIKNYKLVKAADNSAFIGESTQPSVVMLKKIENKNDLSKFEFGGYSNILPFKDKCYVENRFFEYPFYEYDVFLAIDKNSSVAKNIVVCRQAIAKDSTGNAIASAYRVVDFYGAETLLPDIIQVLFEKVKTQGDEFLDFICHGFDERLLLNAGMKSLNFNSTETVIPNWFEPLVRKNVAVNCIADRTTNQYRQCKADGDQDRPSIV